MDPIRKAMTELRAAMLAADVNFEIDEKNSYQDADVEDAFEQAHRLLSALEDSDRIPR